jgi:hypothetical protein
MSPAGWILLLGFPAIVAAAVLYPAYAVVRYRIVLAHGHATGHRQLRRAGTGLCAVLTLAAYAVSLAAVLTDAFPGLWRLMVGGGLGLIVPLLLVDILVGAIFSVDRAKRTYRRRSAVASNEGQDQGKDARIP